MLKREELLKLFETAGAIRHGHFELSSGLHSGTYVQCALVLQYPRFAEKLGQALGRSFRTAGLRRLSRQPWAGSLSGRKSLGRYRRRKARPAVERLHSLWSAMPAA